MSEFLSKPTCENFFKLSYKFTSATKIGSKKIIETLAQARVYGDSAQVMLGNAIFAVGNTEKLAKLLAKFGKVYISTIGDKAKVF
jgi:pantoate kinase